MSDTMFFWLWLVVYLTAIGVYIYRVTRPMKPYRPTPHPSDYPVGTYVVGLGRTNGVRWIGPG